MSTLSRHTVEAVVAQFTQLTPSPNFLTQIGTSAFALSNQGLVGNVGGGEKVLYGTTEFNDDGSGNPFWDTTTSTLTNTTGQTLFVYTVASVQITGVTAANSIRLEILVDGLPVFLELRNPTAATDQTLMIEGVAEVPAGSVLHVNVYVLGVGGPFSTLVGAGTYLGLKPIVATL